MGWLCDNNGLHSQPIEHHILRFNQNKYDLLYCVHLWIALGSILCLWVMRYHHLSMHNDTNALKSYSAWLWVMIWASHKSTKVFSSLHMIQAIQYSIYSMVWKALGVCCDHHLYNYSMHGELFARHRSYITMHRRASDHLVVSHDTSITLSGLISKLANAMILTLNKPPWHCAMPFLVRAKYKYQIIISLSSDIDIVTWETDTPP